MNGLSRGKQAARGSNQYSRRGRGRDCDPPVIPALDLALQISSGQTYRCHQIWGGRCQVPVNGPDWSHGQHPDTDSKWAAASRPTSPPAVLEQLSCDRDFEIRSAVARNQSCPVPVLKTLSADESWHVSSGVASNPLCPAPMLRKYSSSDYEAVRLSVARNPRCPLTALVRLLDDIDPDVSQAAARNGNLPRAVLAMWQLTQ